MAIDAQLNMIRNTYFPELEQLADRMVSKRPRVVCDFYANSGRAISWQSGG